MTTAQSWATGLGLKDAALASVLILTLAVILIGRLRRGARWPELLCVAGFGAWLIFMIMVVFSPLPGSPPPLAFPGAQGRPLISVNTSFNRHGFLSGGLTSQNVQNLLLTVPFGFGLPFVVRWRQRWLALACAALPVGFEGGQLLVSLAAGWAYRGVDVNDWVANTAGGLLGLALFAQVTWVLSLIRSGATDSADRRRTTWRNAAASALAVAGATVVLWVMGPAQTLNYATACEGTPPAGATHPLNGWTAYVDGDFFCLDSPDGSNATEVGSPDPVVQADEHGGVSVIGQVPARAARVVVTLPDGRSTEATVSRLDGRPGWSTFAAKLDPERGTGTTAPATARVEPFTADGSPLP